MVSMLDASHHGLVYRMTGENARSLQRSTTTLSSLDGTLSVNRIAESINNTTKKGRTNWNINNLTGTLEHHGTTGRMPGACREARRCSAASMGPFLSIGLPRASTTRPRRAGPTGKLTI
jgi:hypothetical protein